LTSKLRLPFEIPPEEYPPPSTFIEETISCVKQASEEGIVLRAIGGLAIYLHTPEEQKGLWEKLFAGRAFKDIDFASYGKFRQKVFAFFKKRGYDVDLKLHMHYFKKRHIYFGGRVPMIDVFFDKLEMNHVIDLNKRLETDYPTIPLAELLLQKLQTVQIVEKDIRDAVVMLRAHDLGKTDNETINLDALVKADLTADWGFHYTITTNLRKVKDFIPKCDVLTDNDARIIDERINKILTYIEEQPKSLGWQLRAKIGAKKKWYNDVEDWSFFRVPEE